MTTLRKEQAVLPEGADTQGTPGTPGTPAYCTTQTVPVVTYSERLLYVIQNPNGSYTQVAPGTAGAILIVQPATSIRYETQTVCYPAVEATPGTPATTTLTDAQRFNMGWDGAARSVDELTGDGAFSFSTSINTMGAVVGLNDYGTSPGFLDIDHAFYFGIGLFRVRERGVNKTAAQSFSDTDVFRLVRSGSTVRYYKNDELLYTSDLPSYGTVFLDASLYAAGDSVVDAFMEESMPAAITPTGYGYGVLPAFQSVGGEEIAQGTAVLPAFTGSATGVTQQGGIATLPAFRGFGGDYASASGYAVLPAFTGSASDVSHDAPAFSGGTAILPRMIGSGVSETHNGVVRPHDSLTDASQMWEPNSLDGLMVYIVSGTGSGQSRTIATNNQYVLFTTTNWTTNPDDTSRYEVRSGSTVLYSGTVDGFQPQTLPAFAGLASDYAYAGGYAELPAFTGTAFDAEVVQNYALLTFEGPYTVFAIAEQIEGNVFDFTLSMPTLEFFGDARLSVTGPSPTLEAEGDVSVVGAVNVSAPMPTLEMEGTVGFTGQFILAPFGQFTLEAYGGAYADLTIAGPYSTEAEASAGNVGTVDVTLSSPFVITAEATQHNFGVALLTMPMIVPVNDGWAILNAPRAMVEAEGGPIVATVEPTDAGSAWVMNLANGALTRYTGYQFRQFIRLGDDYYGVADDGLYLLGAEDDDGTAIAWSVKTGATDFGTRKLKRMVSAYFGARMGTAMTATVHALEQGSYSYAYANPRGASPQNYRVKFGRGFNDRYYAIGLSGTKPVEIDEMDLEVVTQGGSL